MNEKSLSIAINLLAIYFIISQFMAVYFWYTFAQNHDFFITLFIGPFIAEIKGFLWPFFI